jgi:ATP-dependent DNA ligase
MQEKVYCEAGLRPTRMGFCERMPAKLVRELPEGAEWQSEVKWDGYRVQVLKNSETVRVLVMRGN